jgi:alpha-L-fucosidase
VDPAIVPVPGLSGAHIIASLQHGDPHGTVWRPAEADTSIRPGWFYHPAEDDRVKSVDRLVEIYFRSVGRNSKLLLNVPPTPAGLLHDVDVSRLQAFHNRLETTFEAEAVSTVRASWKRTSPTRMAGELELDRPRRVGCIRLQEPIENGQTVINYVCSASNDGDWQVISTGATIGYARLDRFDPMVVRRVRLEIEEAVGPAGPIEIRLFAA